MLHTKTRAACRASARQAWRSCRGGFTLAEGLIASVVLAASVIGIAGALSASYQQSTVSDQSAKAVSLARQLMEEITSKPFEDPSDASRSLGPGADETCRAEFDNVDDYHGYSDSSDALETLGGDTLDLGGEGSYSRTVAVEFRDTPDGGASSTGDYALVKVTVTAPNGRVVELSQLMAAVQRGD